MRGTPNSYPPPPPPKLHIRCTYKSSGNLDLCKWVHKHLCEEDEATKAAAGGSSADAGGEVPPDFYAEAQTPATPSVVSRLYQPQAAYLRHQQHERMREESRQQELEQCSFKPEINPPLRSNVATNVASRYRKPSPAKSRHLPTGAAECTFSPAVNSTPPLAPPSPPSPPSGSAPPSLLPVLGFEPTTVLRGQCR